MNVIDVLVKQIQDVYSWTNKLIGRSNPNLLREQLHFIQNKVIQNISSLTLQDLESKAEQPIAQKHPIGQKKIDTVSWNIKHTMWHCGQVASINRLIHGGFDFGLPRRN
jgi:hypothetical protein